MPANSSSPKIYLWPNLMTAGNLFCGFFAIITILTHRIKEADGQEFLKLVPYYYGVVALILGACVFDALDGRVARMVGAESPFGREFDSLADVVSFGVAPALLVYEIVLRELDDKLDRLGWIIAFFYLLCGAMRLARFNCVAAASDSECGGGGGSGKYFQGCPIPAAAGVISSLTLLLLGIYENDREIGNWKYALVVVMILVSILMFSSVPYPSFKGLAWGTRRSYPWVMGAFLIVLLTVWQWRIMLPVLFLGYLAYGLIRPWISKRIVQELEDEPEDDEEDTAAKSP